MYERDGEPVKSLCKCITSVLGLEVIQINVNDAHSATHSGTDLS